MLIIAGVIFLAIYIHKNFKTPKIGAMSCVTGGVKSGKSTFSFHLAYSTYKRNLRAVKFRNFFKKIFSKPLDELPQFYTTIPVAVPHILLTEQLLMREHRFAYKSVIWVDEASILADSMCYKDLDINDRLCLFNKLIAHETRGGTIVYNSQAVGDLHYSIKRCLSETFYVHSTFKWLPFFLVVTLREERYTEDGSTVNSYNDDIEESLKRVIIPKSVWKKFDCYCYSSMTDKLPVYDTAEKADTLKAKRILSFNERHSGEIDEETGKLRRENSIDYTDMLRGLEDIEKENS